MYKYYCPYCPYSTKIFKRKIDRPLYCVNCGDPLVRLNRIKVNQVFAIIVSIAFIAPLLVVAFSLFLQQNKPDKIKSNPFILTSIWDISPVDKRSNV